ncbi:MAG: hypothetical protein OER21_10345 [Gemmatimonadota bacterium]|nr:hypothetical protein [Gemmatimonadota bacterium]
MKSRFCLGVTLAAIVAVPRGAPAQEMEMPRLGDLAAVSTWEINPADLGTFLTVATKVVQAAKQAKLGADYGWTMWQNFYAVTLVGPFNKAELDDPQVWMKQFMGTPGEATLMQAFQEFESVGILKSTMEIHQEMPDWSYMPAGMTQPSVAWVHVHEFWLKSGQANFMKWNALVKDVMAFFKEMGYAYPVWGNMIRYGDARMLFVTGYDNPGEYHGAKSIEAVAEKRGAAARWQQLTARMAELSLRLTDSHHQYRPAQSYEGMPPAQPGAK